MQKLSLVSVFALFFIILAKSPFSESLWLDETVSAWVISGNYIDVIRRAWDFQAQSPLYFLLLKGHASFWGTSEFGLRSFSVVALLLSLVFLYLFARLYFKRQEFDAKVAGIVCLGFLVQDSVIRSLISARPYCLALLGLCGALYFVEKTRCNRLFLVPASACILLMVYSHYLFFPATLILLYLFSQGKTFAELIKSLWLYVMLLFFLLLPAAAHLLDISKKAKEYSYSAVPTFLELLKAPFPPVILVYLVCSFLLALLFCKQPITRPYLKNSKMLAFLVLWAILAPGVCFLASYFSGSSFWLERHYLWGAPAVALCIGYSAAILTPKAQSVFLMTLVGFALFRETARVWYFEDWKTASVFITEAAQKEKILVHTGLIELESPRWIESPDFETQEYLRSPLLYYGLSKDTNIISAGITKQKLETALLNAPSATIVLQNNRYFPRDQQSFRALKRITGLLTELGYTVNNQSNPQDPVQRLQIKKVLM